MTFSGPLVETSSTRALGLGLRAAGFVVVLAAGARLLPHGTATFRCGLPAVLGLRVLTSVAFMGVGGLIPLMLVQTRSVGPALAGASLGVTGTLWAAGMGVASPTSSTQVLTLSPASEHGRASAAQSLAISMAVAVPTGLGGTVIALRGASIDGSAFGVLMLVGAMVAGVAALLSRRVSC